MKDVVTMATECCYKSKEQVLTPTKVVPGKGDFEVPELPRMQWSLSADDGEAHELHPPSKDAPGIVVHVCEDPDGYRDRAKPPMVQTKCPDRST